MNVTAPQRALPAEQNRFARRDRDNRLPALDGLRGVAALLGLGAAFWAGVPQASGGLLGQGARVLAPYLESGVTLFLVLSGFLVGGSLLRRRGGAGFFRQFVVRRTCRLVPLYVVLLAATYFAGKVLFPRDADLWEPAVGMLVPWWCQCAFLQNLFMALAGSMNCGWLQPSWFLALLVQFYVVLPLVIRVVAIRQLPVVLGAGMVACWLFRWGMQVSGVHPYVAQLTLPGRADALILGVLLAWAWQHEPARAWLVRERQFLGRIAGAAGLLFVAAAEGLTPDWFAAPFAVVRHTLLALAFGGVMLTILADERGALAQFLAQRALVFFGLISFALYLAHEPVNSLLHASMLHDWPQMISAAGVGVTAGSVLLVTALAWLAHRWVEHPLQRWARQVTESSARRTTTAGMPAPYASPPVRWARRMAAALRRRKPAYARSAASVR